MSTESITGVVASIRTALEKETAAREMALRHCRAAIQACSRAIRAMHRRSPDEVQQYLTEARMSIEGIADVLQDHPAQYYSGYVHDALKEYAEAATLAFMLEGRPVPTPAEIGVQPAAYLNGLAEAASEGRRYVLDRLREGDLSEAERVLSIMDDVYYELISCDFPDAVTGGLRRTTDALRAVLERTRGDVTLALQQETLRRALLMHGDHE